MTLFHFILILSTPLRYFQLSVNFPILLIAEALCKRKASKEASRQSYTHRFPFTLLF